MLRLVILIVVTTLNFSLGLLVLFRNPRHWVNRSFALFALAVAGWSGTQVSNIVGSEPALFWSRSAFLMAGLSVFALVLFFHTFPSRESLPSSWPVVGLGISAIAMAVISMFTPWIVTAVARTDSGRSLTYGPMYRFFAAYTFSCVGYSLALIIMRIRRAKESERQQLIYVFLALLVPGILAVITNLVVPLLTGGSPLSTYGPIFSVLMIAMVAHAIIRHRFMNVRLVVRRGAVYLIAAIIAGICLVSMLFLADRLTGGTADDAPLEVQVIVGLLVALAFNPFKNRIQTWLDRYVYRQTYDYQKTIRDATSTIASILDLKSVLSYLCDMTSRTFRPDLVAVFTRDPGSDSFELAARHAFGGDDHLPTDSGLAPDSPLPSLLARSRRHLLRDPQSQNQFNPDLKRAGTHLAQLGGNLALPMFSENQLIGFLVLGSKLSGDAYYPEDVELLSTLSSQAAIAVKNAQLYRQVVLVNDYIENILSTMDSGVITVDAHGKVALVNATAERLTGLSKSLLTSMTVDQLPRPLASPLRAALSDGHPRLQVETNLPADAERQTPIVCSTSALRDDRHAVVGALIVFSDLTQVKVLESEKRRAERLAAFGALVSGIAHEIKNPLVAIRTFAELLPDRFSETDFREDFSKVVITEIDRIDDLVGRLRGLAVPSLQQVTAVDIREPITETLALLRGKIEHTQTVVHREFLDTAPHISVDSAQLKQLFLNLFLNAIEAMGNGGQLTVRVQRRSTNHGSWVCAEVTDTGPGIADTIRNHIFDPFFTTKPRGSGLGLAICRGITDAHRGTIRAESNAQGAGAVIVVEFPAASHTTNLVEQSAVST